MLREFSTNLEQFFNGDCHIYLRESRHDELRRWAVEPPPVYVANQERQTYSLQSGLGLVELKEGAFIATRCVELLKLMLQYYLAYYTTERRLQKYKATDEVVQLLATLKTPLNTLLDATQLLARENDNQYVHTIMQCGLRIIEQLNEIIDQLRLHSNTATLAAQPFRLHKIVDEVIELARITADARKVQIALVDTQHVLTQRYTGDGSRIRQILQVIVNNAVRYTNQGTIVVIKAERIDTNVVVRVCDNGPGMPQNARASLFQSSTTNLSLLNAYNFARLMGGSVHLDPEYRPGCCFIVSLPLQRSNEELNAGFIKGKSVLIVKRDPERLTSYAAAWQMLPQVCSQHEQAKVCLAHISYNVVWTGVESEHDINLAAYIKKNYPRTKLLGLSRIGLGFSGEHHFDRLIEVPFSEYDLLEGTIALVGESRLCETFPRFERMMSSVSMLQYHNVLMTSECPQRVIDLVQTQLNDVVSHSKVVHKEHLGLGKGGAWSCFITSEQALALSVTEQYKAIQCILLTNGRTGVLTPQIQEVDVSLVTAAYLRQQLQRAAQESFRSRFD